MKILEFLSYRSGAAHTNHDNIIIHLYKSRDCKLNANNNVNFAVYCNQSFNGIKPSPTKQDSIKCQLLLKYFRLNDPHESSIQIVNIVPFKFTNFHTKTFIFRVDTTF